MGDTPSPEHTPTPASDGAATTVTCHSCFREIPDGTYCGACGADLTEATPRGAHRLHAFAADPSEHVLGLSVVTTLFPHLPHRQTAPFRVAVFVTALTLLVLGALRLTGPAVAAAAVLVPLLYLLYVYEVEVYEDEPIRVLASTFAVGAILGVPWALLTGSVITQQVVAAIAQGPSVGAGVMVGAVLPLAAQVVMSVGGVLIVFARRFDEALDGFTFAAASALGFTLTTTLINLLPQLREGSFTNVPALTNALSIAQRGLLVPIINASVSGLLGAALWLRLGPTRPAARRFTTSVLMVAAMAVVVRVLLGELTFLQGGTWFEVAGYALGAIVMILAVRLAIHDMLLAEAVDVPIGEPFLCSHCGRLVPRMAFCTHCGVATRATPKTGAGRMTRTFRKVRQS